MTGVLFSFARQRTVTLYISRVHDQTRPSRNHAYPQASHTKRAPTRRVPDDALIRQWSKWPQFIRIATKREPTRTHERDLHVGVVGVLHGTNHLLQVFAKLTRPATLKQAVRRESTPGRAPRGLFLELIRRLAGPEGRNLNAASIHAKYSVGPLIRPICTRCCLTMSCMIQVCSNFHRSRVLTTNARPDEGSQPQNAEAGHTKRARTWANSTWSSRTSRSTNNSLKSSSML